MYSILCLQSTNITSYRLSFQWLSKLKLQTQHQGLLSSLERFGQPNVGITNGNEKLILHEAAKIGFIYLNTMNGNKFLGFGLSNRSIFLLQALAQMASSHLIWTSAGVIFHRTLNFCVGVWFTFIRGYRTEKSPTRHGSKTKRRRKSEGSVFTIFSLCSEK